MLDVVGLADHVEAHLTRPSRVTVAGLLGELTDEAAVLIVMQANKVVRVSANGVTASGALEMLHVGESVLRECAGIADAPAAPTAPVTSDGYGPVDGQPDSFNAL